MLDLLPSFQQCQLPHANGIIIQEGISQAKHAVMIMVISNSFQGWAIQH